MYREEIINLKDSSLLQGLAYDEGYDVADMSVITKHIANERDIDWFDSHDFVNGKFNIDCFSALANSESKKFIISPARVYLNHINNVDELISVFNKFKSVMSPKKMELINTRFETSLEKPLDIMEPDMVIMPLLITSRFEGDNHYMMLAFGKDKNDKMSAVLFDQHGEICPENFAKSKRLVEDAFIGVFGEKKIGEFKHNNNNFCSKQSVCGVVAMNVADNMFDFKNIDELIDNSEDFSIDMDLEKSHRKNIAIVQAYSKTKDIQQNHRYSGFRDGKEDIKEIYTRQYIEYLRAVGKRVS